MESGPKRNLYFDKECKNKTWSEASIVYKDGKIHLRQCTCTIKANGNSYYVYRSESRGLTISEDLKVRTWFGKHITEINLEYLHKLIVELKLDWFPKRFSVLLSTSLFQRMVRKKITNPVDFCAAWLRQNKIKASPKLTYKIFINSSNEYGIVSLKNTKKLMILYASVAENHETMIQNWGKYKNDHTLDDMVKQAQILEKKISFNWSDRKLMDVHTDWTTQLMELEHADMEDSIVTYKFELPPVPSNFKLLTTKKEVFIEGKTMHHCIFTNYWSDIEAGQYLAYSIVDEEGNRATLGVKAGRFDTSPLRFDQCYTKYNRTPSASIRKQVTEWERGYLSVHNDMLAQQNVGTKLSAKFELVEDRIPQRQAERFRPADYEELL